LLIVIAFRGLVYPHCLPLPPPVVLPVGARNEDRPLRFFSRA